MVVALVSVGFAALPGALGWLAVSVTNVQADVARLEVKFDAFVTDFWSEMRDAAAAEPAVPGAEKRPDG